MSDIGHADPNVSSSRLLIFICNLLSPPMHLRVFLVSALCVSARVTLRKNDFHPPVEAPADVNVQDEFDLTIETPDLRARNTSKLILGNGLKVFIISDPGIVKAGAALSVETGSWRDPPGVSGLGISFVILLI